ncbi:hypothetical protein [Myxococcus sp. RHSTA-1-4]|uniref:hypothetical protein n=1 Tax=Myxococcus sp. RHSTA-1-4 TaxID=2874601 RepID=UPI001CBA772A|nr:hypothetical protein [Myxococcus sp. RHSTA-1-4]MBZ4423287.1 hypothetical protein [Myxococcus sp. RHSTA-1-4]
MTAEQFGPKNVELTFTPAPCDDPKALALWVFDEQRERILARGAATAKTKLGPFPFPAYQKAYREEHPLRMHVSLAATLAHLARELKGHPVLERLDLSGLHCTLNAEGKGVVERVYAAAASGGFEVTLADPTSKTRLRITANPGSRDWLVASFHPGRILTSLTQGDLAPGVPLFYWFELVALNGQSQLHFFGGETTGEGDGAITLAHFESLAARTSEHLRVTHAEPGRYRKVVMHDQVPATEKQPAQQLTFKPSPSSGRCEVAITARVTGAPEDLNQYTATFYRKVPGKETFKPIKGFIGLRPEKLDPHGEDAVTADWLVSARVPYPQNMSAPTEFKVELVALDSDREPASLVGKGTYDFTPRWRYSPSLPRACGPTRTRRSASSGRWATRTRPGC